MSIERFQSLLYRSGKIRAKIDAEKKRNSPDMLRILKLKTLGLQISDRLHKTASHDSAMRYHAFSTEL